MKRIVKFFKDMFSFSAGEYHPKEKKINPKWVIYWVIGIILTILLPVCLVFLEAWEFNWNVIKIIWVEGENYLFRGGHFMFGMTSILFFVTLGYMTPEHMNGDKEQYAGKQTLMWFMVLSVVLWVSCFIVANILY